MLEQAATEGGSNKQSEMNVSAACLNAFMVALTHLQALICFWRGTLHLAN